MQFYRCVARLYDCLSFDDSRLWPVAVMVSPLVVGIAVCIANQNDTLLPMLRIYILLLGIGLIIYMVREVRRYGHWLRDNYADLEHKEVWKSFLVLAIMMLVLGIYASGVGGMAYEYAVQTLAIVLVCYLLWRVETLSNLSIPLSQDLSVAEPAITEAEDVEDNSLSQTNRENIGTLLQQHCIDTQLYLQHDLNISQLAKTIGVNRLYLTTTLISMIYASSISSVSITRLSLPIALFPPNSWLRRVVSTLTAPLVKPSNARSDTRYLLG